ncbi:hypothetical protein J6590_073844 [Homalodisca vitripennis]|nr:hypothetical protein J6590_073844 [Homalodisca vitripennis]
MTTLMIMTYSVAGGLGEQKSLSIQLQDQRSNVGKRQLLMMSYSQSDYRQTSSGCVHVPAVYLGNDVSLYIREPQHTKAIV